MPNYKTTNPGRKQVYRIQPTRENEKFNTFDAADLVANIDSIIDMAEGLSDDEKQSIRADVMMMQQDAVQVMSEHMATSPYTVTNIATANKSWMPFDEKYADHIKKFRSSCNKLSDALENTLKKQPDDEKNPFMVYYADYIRGLANNRSAMYQYGTDPFLEKISVVINSNVNLKQGDKEGYTYSEICDKMHDVPLVSMLSEANAMHRIIINESISGDLQPDRELKDKAKVIELSNKYLADYRALENYDTNTFDSEYYDTKYVQNNKEQFLTRGLGSAAKDAQDRIKAVEHGWLVRDLPLISRCRFMSDELNSRLKKDENLSVEQKEQINEFNKFFNEQILNNSEPMDEARRTELIAGIKSKFLAIDIPEIKTANRFHVDGKFISNDNYEGHNKIDACRAQEMIAQIEATENRQLANYEKATLNVAENNFEKMIEHFDNMFENMPQKPSMFLRVSGEFENLENAYRLFKLAVQNSDDPSTDEDVQEKAKELFEATGYYNEKKDAQKNIDYDNTTLSERRSKNLDKRSEYGQYRYNLSDELHTFAGLVKNVCGNEEYRKLLTSKQSEVVKKTSFKNLKMKLNVNDNLINKSNNQDDGITDQYAENHIMSSFNKKKKKNTMINI